MIITKKYSRITGDVIWLQFALEVLAMSWLDSVVVFSPRVREVTGWIPVQALKTNFVLTTVWRLDKNSQRALNHLWNISQKFLHLFSTC